MTDIRKKEIIDQLRQIEGELSPENLCMDGEASPAYVRRRYQELMKEKSALVTELGYEPDIYELYPKLRRPPTDA